VSQSEFKRITFQFNLSWRHPDRPRPVLRHIYNMSLAGVNAVEDRHKNYMSQIGNVQSLWHGTARECTLGDSGADSDMRLCNNSKCALCGILRKGFRKNRAKSTGMYGLGLYACTASSKATWYSKNGARRSSCHVVLLNDVSLGETLFTNDPHPGWVIPPIGYNSVCGLPGSALKYDEVCVYDDNAILPTHLVVYDSEDMSSATPDNDDEFR